MNPKLSIYSVEGMITLIITEELLDCGPEQCEEIIKEIIRDVNNMKLGIVIGIKKLEIRRPTIK